MVIASAYVAGCPILSLVTKEGGVILRALLLLPSPDAFRVAGVCADMRALLSGEQSPMAPTKFWNAASGGARGLYSSSVIWLHTLASASLIKAYKTLMRSVVLIGTLQFQDARALWQVDIALNRLSTTQLEDIEVQRPHLFVTPFSFEGKELSVMESVLCTQPLRSEPVLFRGFIDVDRHVNFAVQLVLTRVVDRVAFVFEWSYSPGELSVEEQTLVEIEVNGLALAPGTMGGVLVTGRNAMDLPELQADSSCQVAADVLCTELRKRSDLVCLMKLAFRYMVEDQVVVPVLELQASGAVPHRATSELVFDS